jgi:diguanylate cyclase (GGDEF)-like protein
MAALKPSRPLGSAAARVWAFTALVSLVSAAIWWTNIHGPGPPGSVSLQWWELAITFYLAEAWVVHVHLRKQTHTLSHTEIGLVLGLFFATPVALLVGQLAGSGLALAVNRRQKSMKLAFNLAEQSLCTGLALLVFRSVLDAGGSGIEAWGVALAAAAVSHTCGVLLVSAVIAVAEGHVIAPQLLKTLAISLVGALATACVGLIAVVLVEDEALALVLVVPVVVACALAFRGYMAQREQREHMEFLYESMRATQGAPEFGLAVGQLLVAARRLLRADYAEILLVTQTPGEPVLRSTSGAAGELLMHPEELTRAARIGIDAAANAEHPLLLGHRREPHDLDGLLEERGIADAIVGALRGEERLFGLLLVGGRIGDVGTFDDADLTLFETFAGHASVLLENGRLEQSLAQLIELKEELRHQAYHDALTGLPNRVLFAEHLAETLAQEHSDPAEHAVLFLDLDRFKNVNDSWGHAVGDELLVQVAERIRKCVRPDDIPARLGGDEFAVLLKQTDAAGAEQAARRLVDALAAPFSLSGREATIEASIGIAITGPQATTVEELLRNADVAMYVAKGNDARRYAAYEPALHARLRRRQELGLQLNGAVERNEIVVHFQPILSLTDGSIRAFEALARWQHPERGLLLPGDFLGLAEESGLIIKIGASVLAQSLQAASSWQYAFSKSPEIGLWVNLSPAELVNERLVEDVALALTHQGFDADRLTLEITESGVMRDEYGAVRAMRRLHELGVNLSLDDFGTGYSSLARLAEFPIDRLKIPKPFVDRLADADADTSFMDAILRLAESLGLQTVAEGIEHDAQTRRLRELGCELGQGYLFGEPVPARDVRDLLRTRLALDESSLRAVSAA